MYNEWPFAKRTPDEIKKKGRELIVATIIMQIF